MYTIRNNNLHWVDKKQNPRICVPKKYRAAIISEFHDTILGAHFGIDKTLGTLQKHYIWPSMRHHVTQFVLSCDACQKNKTVHKKPLGQPTMIDIPDEPWEQISIDFSGTLPKTKRGHDYVCGIICNLTRASILIPCSKDISAAGTAKLYVQHVLPRVGLPKVITSDRGPQFISNFWQSLWKLLGTKVSLVAPYHPQSNSLIERQNKTFMEALRSFVNARQDNWDELLVIYEFAYNNSINDSTGETPFFLNHGRHPTIPALIGHPSQSPAADDFVQHLRTSIIEARDHIMKSRGARADARVQDLTPHTFQVGDKVLLSTQVKNFSFFFSSMSRNVCGSSYYGIDDLYQTAF